MKLELKLVTIAIEIAMAMISSKDGTRKKATTTVVTDEIVRTASVSE